MPSESDQPVTELLRAAQAGDAAAAERLLAVVYEQLHQLARARSSSVTGWTDSDGMGLGILKKKLVSFSRHSRLKE